MEELVGGGVRVREQAPWHWCLITLFRWPVAKDDDSLEIQRPSPIQAPDSECEVSSV